MDVPRLVQVSVQRDTPLDVLAVLRASYPDVELVHVGDNRWWLGNVRPSPATKGGLSPLAAETVGEHFRRDLQRQGFRWLGEYTDDQLSASYLLAELDFMFNAPEMERDELFQAAMAQADGSAADARREAAIRDKLAQEGRSTWAILMRRRHSVYMRGQRELAAERAAASAVATGATP